MSSPITFSGFNSIDFNTVLTLMMKQESVPRDTLAEQQTSLKSKYSALATLSTKVGALSSAAENLKDSSGISGRTASSSDSNIVGATCSSSAVPGTYEVVVTKLASAQVTAATTQFADKDTTVIANGGTITIGSKTVDLSDKSVTLQGLADAINETSGIGVSASVIRSAPNKYQLVLTGNESGSANAFTITNDLTLDDEDPLIAFGGNARTAVDAELTVNGVPVTSASNSVSDAIAGATLQLRQKTAVGQPVTVTVAKDSSNAESNVKSFVDAYNSLVTFINAQGTDTDSLSRDPMLRSMWSQLRGLINSQYGSGTSKSSLSAVGVGFDTTGKLTFDSTALGDALDESEAKVLSLFTGKGSTDGAFTSISDMLDGYVGSGGLIYATRNRINDQVKAMDKQLASWDDRLATRKAALQKQFTATDSLISQLNSQSSTLSNLGYSS